jgi:CDP-diacylglycerol--glycerol-3-phosphate 3-phosphatidyltransferase
MLINLNRNLAGDFAALYWLLYWLLYLSQQFTQHPYPQRQPGMMREQRQSLAPLRRQWLLVMVGYLAALLVGHNLLQQAWSAQEVLQWVALTAGTMAIQMTILWWALPHNRRGEQGGSPYGSGRLLPTLGYANTLTLLRGLLTCLLAGFLFAPLPTGIWAWAPAILYTLERLVDFADGYVARITHSETKLGEILDIEFDGLGFLIAIALGIQYGKLPPWYLVLGFSRQLFVLGMWLRRRAGKPLHDLPPSEHRRIIAGFQTGFITLVLWPLWPPDVTLLAAYVMAIPLVFSFGRDWLVVSGVVDAAAPAYQRARGVGKRLIEGWLPLVARIAAALLALPILWQASTALAPWQAGNASSSPQIATLTFGGGILLGLLAVVMVLLGAAGRVGALVLAAIAAANISAAGLHWEGNALLLVCSLVVAHLGSGKWALWRPEEPLLRAKAGAPRP